MKKNLKCIRWIKWLWQKITRGYSDADIWDLYGTIIRFILPRLIAYRRAERIGYPSLLKDERMTVDLFRDKNTEAGAPNIKAWNRILDKMIYWMISVYGDETKLSRKYKIKLPAALLQRNMRKIDYVETHKISEEGRVLFVKYFASLWD